MVQFALKYRFIIVITTVILTLFFGYQIKNLRIETDITKFFPKEDRAVQLYNHTNDVFGSNDVAVALFLCQDVFASENILLIAELTARFKAVEGISTVTSIADVIDIKKTPDGGIEIGKLIDPRHIPETQAELDQIKKYALGKELYRNRILSSDAKAALIVCRIRPDADKFAINKELRQIVQSMGLQSKVNFGGQPVLQSEIQSIVRRDLVRLMPIVIFLLVITLSFSFKSLRGVIIPLGTVLICVIWTIGAMSLFKVPFSVISDIIPILLIAIGTAPCIHILSKYNENFSLYGSKEPEVMEAFSEVGFRVMLASITIILGFSSFIFGTYLTIIRHFGIFMSLGIFLSLLLSLFFIPAILSYIHVSGKKQSADTPGKVKDAGKSRKFWNFVLNEKWFVVSFTVILLGVGILGVPRIEHKIDIIDFFKPQTEVRKTTKLIEKYFWGATPVNVLVKGDMQNPWQLKEMQRFQKYIEAQGIAHTPMSVADLILEMNDVIDNEKVIPDSKDKITNLWFLLEGQEIMPTICNSDNSEGVVGATVGTIDVKQLNNLIKSIDDYVKYNSLKYAEVDTPSLSQDARGRILSYRIDRTVDAIGWDARRRQHGVSFDRQGIQAIMQKVAGSEIPDEAKIGAIFEGVTEQLPEQLRNDSLFMVDMRNDILELKQSKTIIPVSMYQQLIPAGNGDSVDTISFDMTQADINVIYRNLDRSLMESQAQSFLIAMVFIFLMLFFQLRSWLGGVLGLIPNIVTVVLVFGIMGLTGISLNIATVLVASIALGIGIDYAIHFNMRYKHFYQQLHEIRPALEKTLQTTGKAISINVLAVTMGFIALYFAEMIPVHNLGVLVAIAMIGSGAGALTLLPVSILFTKVGFGSKKQLAVESTSPGIESPQTEGGDNLIEIIDTSELNENN
ncbi:MAG: MMPL family transporter [Candidatus Zixiibacteriota bacterium]